MWKVDSILRNNFLIEDLFVYVNTGDAGFILPMSVSGPSDKDLWGMLECCVLWSNAMAALGCILP